jgi:hypothetical protein
MKNRTGITATFSFEEAANVYLESRKPPYLKQRTWEMYCYYTRQLHAFFGGMRLAVMHAGHIREYQKMRMDKGVGASGINHEVECILVPVLREAGLWEPIRPYYERIPLPRFTKPKVMTDEEESRLFLIASKNPDWCVAYWCASITCNSTASGTELRNLQLRDINFQEDWFEVKMETAKNEYRMRRIPMNATAKKQLMRSVARCQDLGGYAGEHYVFPFRVTKGRYDVTRPASPSFMRKQFEEMKSAANLPWITPHCLRHQAITKLYESGATDESVVEIAGWVSPRMKAIYCKPRMEHKRGLLNQIDPVGQTKPVSKAGATWLFAKKAKV